MREFGIFLAGICFAACADIAQPPAETNQTSEAAVTENVVAPVETDEVTTSDVLRDLPIAPEPVPPAPQPQEQPLNGSSPSEPDELRPARCGMTEAFVHETRHNGDRIVYEDTSGSLLFTTDYAVNTDGARSSYHPDDPYGSEGLAINTICNGANVTMPDGTQYNYSNCRELVSAFRTARDGGWVGDNLPKMSFYGVATEPATDKPCIISEGPYAGYFVSTTSLNNPGVTGDCNPERYLDSLDVPFVIYPGDREFTTRGMGLRDIVAIYKPETDKLVFAIVGDRGPRWGLGEGSVAVSKQLRGIETNPETRRQTYAYGAKGVTTLVLTDTRMSGPFSAEAIEAAGRDALREWGGLERLKACTTLPAQ